MEKTPQSPQEKFSTPEEEITYLKERIRRKEEEVLSSGSERPADAELEAPAREYAEFDTNDVLPKERQLEETELDEITLNLEPEAHDKRMGELLGIMKEKGIKNTLSVIKKMDNPHIEDDFHRFLVQYLKSGHDVEGLDKAPQLKQVLNMTLFEVVLPRADEVSKEKTLRELLSSMEQLYAGLLDRREKNERMHFSIELAVEHVGEEVSFFVAVPEERKELFEKQLLSIFPHASVEEHPDDYNIFNEEGTSVAAYAQDSKKSIFPLKLYEEFEHDPLTIVLNAFSKLAHEGEGAAIQLLIHPDTRGRTQKFRQAIKDIEKGKSVGDAIDIAYSFGEELWQTTRDMFFKSSKKPEKEEGKQDETNSELSRLAVENIRDKLSSPLAAANIRIVASAGDAKRATSILDGLKAAFHQFENTHGNSLSFKDVPQRRREAFLHDISFRVWDSSHEIPLNFTELTTLIHFPVREMKGSREMKENSAVTAPVPLDTAHEGVVLGVNQHRGDRREVRMAQEDRMRHFYVVGQTGTGKSVLLTNMILQDIQNGDGCCFIDPHGTDVEYVLANIPPERHDDVIYFDPSNTAYPMALNMLEYDRNYPEQKTFVVNEMLSIFNKLFDMKTAGGPMFEQYFRNAVLLTLEDPDSGATLLDVSRVLSDANFRKHKLSRAQNPTVIDYWEEVAQKAGGEASLQNIVPYITSKFDVFLSNEIMRPIIAQQSSSLNFREIMDSQKILLVNLSKGRLGDINAHLIGLIIVGKILMAALSRVDSAGETPPFYLYIDEFQNITTDSISTILSEARKYNLSLTVAHQFIKQLQENIRDAVFGNVGSLASFRVSSEDAEFLEKQFAPVFEARDLQNIPNWNAYVRMLVQGTPAKPFSIETLSPPEGNATQVQKLKDMSAQKYGKPREEVEAEILKRYKETKRASDTPDTPLS